MTDLHSHILPGIDDGAKDISQSEEMLTLLKEQGVEKVVLTPHFYPENIGVEDFILSRGDAFKKVQEISSVPLKLGAEVAYSRHLANLDDVEKLCIEGTQYMLLELPFSTNWERFVIDDIQKMSANLCITFIIAHIEMYPAARKNFDYIKKLRDIGCLFQIDAQSLEKMSLSDKLFFKKLYRHGCLHFLASDCHNTTDRKPYLADGYARLSKLLGEQVSNQIKQNSDIIF